MGANQQYNNNQSILLSSSSAAYSSAQQLKLLLNATTTTLSPSTHTQFPVLSPKYSLYFTMFISMLGHLFKQFDDDLNHDDNNNDDKISQPIPFNPKNKHLMAAATMPIILLFLVALLLELALPSMLVYNIEECSPLVLFSWWRNKISWDVATLWFVFEPFFHQTTTTVVVYLCWLCLLNCRRRRRQCRLSSSSSSPPPPPPPLHYQTLHWHKLYFHHHHNIRHQHRHKILFNFTLVRWFLLK